MAPDIFLTAWLDPAMDWASKQTKLPPAELSPIFAGEAMATGIELVSDLAFSTLVGKLVQAGIGGAATLTALFAPLTPRLRKELLELGSHGVGRIIDPKPQDIISIRADIEKIVEGATKGKPDIAVQGIFRTPKELEAMLAAVGVQLPDSRTRSTSTRSTARSSQDAATRTASQDQAPPGPKRIRIRIS